MTKRISLAIITGLFSMLAINACKHDPYVNPADQIYGGFPDAVGKIMINRCATAGCHNAATRQAGLLLDSWEHLFEGGVSGAAVIAYNPELSPLLYFINIDSSLGAVAIPTMPDDSTTLSKEEYLAVRDWVAAGAPNRDGKIPFSDNADTRQKIYLTMQGCDLLGVIDAQSMQVMRYLKVGDPAVPQNLPHCVRVSPDGKYAYVSALNSKYVQRINTATDKIETSLRLPDNGNTAWNLLYITPDNNELIVSNWIENGYISWVNAKDMQPLDPIPFQLKTPHGITSNATGDTLFVTAEKYNAVYKIVPGRNGALPFLDTISIVTGQAPKFNDSSSAPQPHEIMMVPDFSKYLLTCQRSNEVRVLDAFTDQVLAVIPTGTFPQEIAISKTQPYAFITCMEDVNGIGKGCVEVINYKTLQKVRTIRNARFSKPHGIAVDDKNGLVYVASSNIGGPNPHHPPPQSCGSQPNGTYHVYDLNTLEPVNGRSYIVSPAPYSADVRFK